MKIVEVAFAFLVFNVCLSLIVHSGLSSYPMYYESSYITTFSENGTIPSNISTVSEEQQYVVTMNIVDIIISTLSFTWIYQLIPTSLHADFTPFIAGLTAIMWFFISLALIELFVKREEILGG